MTAASQRIAAPSPGGTVHGWLRPVVGSVIVFLGIFALAVAVERAIEDYRDRIALSGLGGKPSPVNLVVAGEAMTIPANMIRFRSARRGGEVDRVDLLLHWPGLEGFSPALADDFKDSSPSAPLIYVSIAARASTLDSSTRLDAVYSRFFEGRPLAGPDGLIGKALTSDSGYGGEIVWFLPKGPEPFVARCMAEATPEIPATCIRDVNIGIGLSMLYRFDLTRLADWRPLDAGLQRLVTGFLAASH
jgi:hypothetical protein